MKEIWKDIIDSEGLYQVSNLGKIRSCHSGKWIILNPTIGYDKKRYRYYRVSLYNKYGRKDIKVHRLVLMTFKGISNLIALTKMA